MANRERFISLLRVGTRAAILALSLGALSLSSCSKMLSGSDVTSEIASQVDEATAEKVTISLKSTPTGGGTLSLSVSQVEKVGIAFSLSAYADSAYVFTSWTVSGSGNVKFSSATTSTTTVTIGTSADDIVITAQFTARPTFTVEPEKNSYGEATSTVYTFTFSEAMDSSTFNSNNISIIGKLNASMTGDYSDLYGDFAVAYDSSSYVLTLTPTSDFVSNYHNYKLEITISSNISSATGIKLQSNTSLTDTALIYTTSGS